MKKIVKKTLCLIILIGLLTQISDYQVTPNTHQSSLYTITPPIVDNP